MEAPQGSDCGTPVNQASQPQLHQPKKVNLMTPVTTVTSSPPTPLHGPPSFRLQPPAYTWALPSAQQPYAVERRGTFNTETQPLPPKRPGSFRPAPSSHQAMRSSFGVHHYPQQPQLNHQPSMGMPAWNMKPYQEFDGSTLDSDMSELGPELLSIHEDTPIIDLRQFSTVDRDNTHRPHRDSLASSRRMSESTYSMSSNGPTTEHQMLEDHSTSQGTQPAEFEWPHSGNQTHGQTSPLPSPGLNQNELIRSGSRSRTSPIQYNNSRAAPYNLETNRAKRWSTGNYNSVTPSRPTSQINQRYSFYGSPLNPNHAFTGSHADLQPINFPIQSPNMVFSPSTYQVPRSAVLASSEQFLPEVPRPLPSQGSFRLLQSNTERLAGCASHFSDLADPPDLFASLHIQPSDPPDSDMNPSDPDLVPHEQDLRFNGDLYTPRWVRGHGNKREGWCGLCKPGRWLVLKNSAFWYDKSFTHGVSAATGAAFQGPKETRRTEGNLDVWEGLCGSCDDWIPLVSSKKKGTTWFRHAYKCHTHPKVKDGPKKRRDTIAGSRSSPDSLLKDTVSSIVDDHKPATANCCQITPSAAPAAAMTADPILQRSDSKAEAPPKPESGISSTQQVTTSNCSSTGSYLGSTIAPFSQSPNHPFEMNAGNNVNPSQFLPMENTNKFPKCDPHGLHDTSRTTSDRNSTHATEDNLSSSPPSSTPMKLEHFPDFFASTDALYHNYGMDANFSYNQNAQHPIQESPLSYYQFFDMANHETMYSFMSLYPDMA